MKFNLALPSLGDIMIVKSAVLLWKQHSNDIIFSIDWDKRLFMDQRYFATETRNSNSNRSSRE
uniref:Uncharacterized protein n=1 Tax=Strigamia maritima TaxID=126957 RepID=T1IYR2_STRMM